MNEADHKHALVAEINILRGGWAERWEDRWRPGILDLVLKLPDPFPIVFAEGKLVVGYKFGPTALQFVKGQRIAAAGLTVVLIGWKGREMAISPWVKQADWRECKIGPNHVATLKEYLRGEV